MIKDENKKYTLSEERALMQVEVTRQRMEGIFDVWTYYHKNGHPDLRFEPEKFIEAKRLLRDGWKALAEAVGPAPTKPPKPKLKIVQGGRD